MKRIIIILSIIGMTYCANAQSKPISQQPNAATLTGVEYIPVVQSGINRKATPLQIKAYFKKDADTVVLIQAISLLPYIIMPTLTTTEINALSEITEGTFIYDSTLHVLKYWNGSVWKTITTD